MDHARKKKRDMLLTQAFQRSKTHIKHLEQQQQTHHPSIYRAFFQKQKCLPYLY